MYYICITEKQFRINTLVVPSPSVELKLGIFSLQIDATAWMPLLQNIHHCFINYDQCMYSKHAYNEVPKMNNFTL